jgi:hypothetical protein
MAGTVAIDPIGNELLRPRHVPLSVVSDISSVTAYGFVADFSRIDDDRVSTLITAWRCNFCRVSLSD